MMRQPPRFTHYRSTTVLSSNKCSGLLGRFKPFRNRHSSTDCRKSLGHINHRHFPNLGQCRYIHFHSMGSICNQSNRRTSFQSICCRFINRHFFHHQQCGKCWYRHHNTGNFAFSRQQWNRLRKHFHYCHINIWFRYKCTDRMLLD